MRKLDVDACVAFQEVFYDKQAGAYSPYEQIQDPVNYYPLALIGEVGSLLNAYCKRERSLNHYDGEIEDEAVDVFLYLIMTPKIVRPDRPEILDGIKEDWEEPPRLIKDDAGLIEVAQSLTTQIAQLSDPQYNAYTPAVFREMFALTKSMGVYVSGKDWQALIDTAHAKYVDIRTKPNDYTPDLRSKGGGYQNFDQLLRWITEYEAPLPPKRLEFLARMAGMQCMQQSTRTIN